MTDDMRVLAARFETPEDAEAVERELRGVLDVGEDDILRHSLGGDLGEESSATVLGGRFRPERLVLVEDVISHHGGEILADVPETWTELRRSIEDG
jgi:hypothetical protein